MKLWAAGVGLVMGHRGPVPSTGVRHSTPDLATGDLALPHPPNTLRHQWREAFVSGPRSVRVGVSRWA